VAYLCFDPVPSVSRRGVNALAIFIAVAAIATILVRRQFKITIDGEAVLLGADGASDFNALHSRRQDEEVQLYAFGRGADIRPDWDSVEPLFERHYLCCGGEVVHKT